MAKAAPKATKIGRNAPCPCGSGRKYKDCHLPIQEAEQARQRKLRQAYDTLLPKLIEAAQGVPQVFPAALAQFWGGKYGIEQMAELDELEDRGAERFLTWLAFDYPLEAGQTLVETLATEPPEAFADEFEQELLQSWRPVRLRVYRIDEQRKRVGFTATELLEGAVFAVTDQAASFRMEAGDLLVGHLVPVSGEAGATMHYIAGAAAHLTGDTAEKLVEFAGLYLEDMRRSNPDATWADLLRERSHILNLFVMALPVEERNPSVVDNLVAQTRAALRLTGETIAGVMGLGPRDEIAAENTPTTQSNEEDKPGAA